MKTTKHLSESDVKEAIAKFCGTTSDKVTLSYDGPGNGGSYNQLDPGNGVTAKAVVSDDAKPASDDPNCQAALMTSGKPYPRTCIVCGLGPCKYGKR